MPSLDISPSISLMTLTGADEFTPLEKLKELAAQPDIEIGLLYSLDERAPRFPSRTWFEHALPQLRGKLALHVCGPSARRELLNDKLSSWMPFLSRVQVNGHVTPDELPLLASRVSLLITQHAEGNEQLAQLPQINHALLVDASGGLGRRPSDWIRPDTGKPVGFAGGLGPENLDAEWPRLLAAARGQTWIDMESSLRDNHDRFDLSKVQAVRNVWRRLQAAP